MLIKKKIILITLSFYTINNFSALSKQDIETIGQKIWQNEAKCQKELLVFWNKNESFPSLGIGHNIWFPEGWLTQHQEVKFTESFPLLCDYLEKNKIVLPAWLKKSKSSGAPWKSREEFYKDEQRLEELRTLLEKTISLQAHFMIDRLEEKLPKIIEKAPMSQRRKISKNITLMRSSLLGTYALVDYLNFKGDGLNTQEAHKGQGWGLLAVLLAMPDNLNKNNVTKAFTVSAAKKLITRIENSAPQYVPLVFFEGWMKRISTYSEEKTC